MDVMGAVGVLALVVMAGAAAAVLVLLYRERRHRDIEPRGPRIRTK